MNEYIPARSSLPRHTGGVEWAVNDFQQQAASIAGQLVAEFRALLKDGDLTKGDGQDRAGVREGSSIRRDESEER